jgi:hypothetical protein
VDSGDQEVEAREEKDPLALLTPLVIVFYSSEDVLKDSTLGFFRKLYKYLVYRIIEIVLDSQYAHVQCYVSNTTHHVPKSGTTGVYLRAWDTTPYSIAYHVQGLHWLSHWGLIYCARQVSLWKNIKWAFRGGRMPINCISDAEMILRFHLTNESNHACKVRRYCRSIAAIEEAIRNFHFGPHTYGIQVSNEHL